MSDPEDCDPTPDPEACAPLVYFAPWEDRFTEVEKWVGSEGHPVRHPEKPGFAARSLSFVTAHGVAVIPETGEITCGSAEITVEFAPIPSP